MDPKAIANVVRVDFITDETTPVLYSGTTMEDVSVPPRVSEGKQNELRSKNVILGQNNYEDLIIGYDPTFKDLTFEPEVFALIDGGTYTAVTGPPAGYHYDGPAVGTALARVTSTVDVWAEEKDADGEVVCYHRFRFPRCKGKPVEFTFKDGVFMVPEYKLRSRALVTGKPILIDQFAELPTGTAPPSCWRCRADLPDLNT